MSHKNAEFFLLIIKKAALACQLALSCQTVRKYRMWESYKNL